MNKSIFYNIDKYLKSKYGYTLKLSDIEDDFKGKIEEHKSITDKIAQKYLCSILLPAISVYQCFIIKGLSEATALNYIEEYVMHYYQRQAKLYRLFGKLPFFYGIFRRTFPLAMKTYFPTPFWKTIWLRNDKQEMTFNVTDCLYHKTFKEYHCEALGPIFCRVDHLNYDNMCKKIRFIRKDTLTSGKGMCDFRFVRAK